MWIDEYRAANNLELDDFARRVNHVGRKIHSPWYCTVTDQLIHILEISKEPRTQPDIADAIATVCGATQEQRDSIVAPQHRGGWEPTKNPYSWRDQPTVIKPSTSAFAVVMVGRDARILKRYKSAREAAKYGDLGEDAIKKRCQRKVPNEFTYARQYTYRYAKDWDCLSRAAKMKDLGVDMYEPTE